MDGQTRREASRNHTFQHLPQFTALAYSPLQLTGRTHSTSAAWKPTKRGKCLDTKRIKETLKNSVWKNISSVGILKSWTESPGFIEAERYAHTVGVGNYLGQKLR